MSTEQTPEYSSLKHELTEIAAILEKYPPELRTRVFEVLLSSFRGEKAPTVSTLSETKAVSEGKAEEESKEELKPDESKQPKAKKRVPDSYSIDPNLSLHGGNGTPNFSQFVNEKMPASNYEFNAVAAYYVIRVLNKPKMTLKEAWTCYKEVKRRTPEFFRQSFTDTKNQKGYIRITDDFDIELSPRGENLVEHDLPPKKEPTK